MTGISSMIAGRTPAVAPAAAVSPATDVAYMHMAMKFVLSGNVQMKAIGETMLDKIAAGLQRAAADEVAGGVPPPPPSPEWAGQCPF